MRRIFRSINPYSAFGIKRMLWSFDLNEENSNLILTRRKALSLMYVGTRIMKGKEFTLLLRDDITSLLKIIGNTK